MIIKKNYYHGSALIKLLDYDLCKNVKKYDFGYLVNDDIFIYFKYRTNTKGPWQFIFTIDEISRLNEYSDVFSSTFLVFICGGDGICSVKQKDFKKLINEVNFWISIKRNFRSWYEVTGPQGSLDYRVSFKAWPEILFDNKR